MPLDPEGIVGFEAGGKSYRLFMGMRAMKEVELHYDKPFVLAVRATMPDLNPEDMGDRAKLAEASEKIRLTDLAKLFEIGLRKFQPEIDEDGADDLIDEIGLTRAGTLVGQALAAALVEEEAGEDASADPPRRKSKTGSRS